MISAHEESPALEAVDPLLIEAASEAVRLMFVDRLKKESAVNYVMTSPRFARVFGHGEEVISLVTRLFIERPELGDHVSWRNNGVPYMKKECWTHCAVTSKFVG